MSRADKASRSTSHRTALWHTRWTEIYAARTLDPERRREALGRIMGRYWRPVYAYLRRKGQDHAEAEDLVQGFFAEVVLGRGRLIQQADPARGKFRTFLLTALDNYTHDEASKRNAKKRRPPGGEVSLDAFEQLPPIPARQATPEGAFTYAWVSQLVDRVLADVEDQCRQAGQDRHWEVFRRTFVEPALSGAAAPALAELCEPLGIATPKQAAAMNVTVKRRLGRVMRAHVRGFVQSDSEVDEEIADLIATLARCASRGS